MIHEDTVDFLAMLGYLDLVHGKGEEAIPLFETLRILKPNVPCITASLAYAYLQANQWKACLSETDACLKMLPPDELAKSLRLIRCRALWKLEHSVEAISPSITERPVSN